MLRLFLFWLTFSGYKTNPVGAKSNALTGFLLYFFELGVVRHYFLCADLFKSYFEHSIIRHFLHTEYHASAVCLMLDRLADGIALRRGGGFLRARAGEAGRSGEAVSGLRRD